MAVIIEELVSHVRALDSESLLAPETLARLVEAVMQAVEDKDALQQRVSDEQSLLNAQQLSRINQRGSG